MASQVVAPEKRLRISLLLDTYGELLTERQREFLVRHFEEDYSFGEIARERSISRQAVFDAVKTGEATLERYEKALGLIAAGGENGRSLPAASGIAALDEAVARLRGLVPRVEPDVAAELEAVARALLDCGRRTADGASREPARGSGAVPSPLFGLDGGPEVD